MKTSSSLMKLSLKYLHCYFQQTNKPPRDNCFGVQFQCFVCIFLWKTKTSRSSLDSKATNDQKQHGCENYLNPYISQCKAKSSTLFNLEVVGVQIHSGPNKKNWSKNPFHLQVGTTTAHIIHCNV